MMRQNNEAQKPLAETKENQQAWSFLAGMKLTVTAQGTKLARNATAGSVQCRQSVLAGPAR